MEQGEGRPQEATGAPQCQEDRPAARRHEKDHMYAVLSVGPEQIKARSGGFAHWMNILPSGGSGCVGHANTYR